MDQKPLIVMDTNVLVAGLCRRKSSPNYRFLKKIQEKQIPLVMTQKLYLEYKSVLFREEIQALTKIPKTEMKIVLNALTALSLSAEVYFLWRPNLPDEGDNFVLETAIATGSILVTHNIKDFKNSELSFPDLRIMTPKQFLETYF